MVRQKMTRRNVVGAAIITALLLSIIAFSVYVAVYMTKSGSSIPANIKRGEIMKTTLRDSEGEAHSVEARFAVEFDEEYLGTVDEKAIFTVINKTLSGLDYERLSQENGLDYVKGELVRALSNAPGVDIDAIAHIYATDFVTDCSLPVDTLPKQDSLSDVFRSLFKKSE